MSTSQVTVGARPVFMPGRLGLGPPPMDPPNEASDAELVKTAQKRGLEGQLAFEVLVDRHQLWLVKLLSHLLGGLSDAEDVAQDAFVRAFLAIGDCTRPEGFRAWLRVIARRLAFNHRRDTATRTKYHERATSLEQATDPGQAAGVEGRELLERALSGISYAYREIMVLRFVEELSTKEVAAVLEIGESAAKMRLSRARAEFERVYVKLGGKHERNA